MAQASTLLALMLLTTAANLTGLAAWNNENYLRDACSVTRYRNLCILSLSSFSDECKTSPSKWARAGVSVALAEAKRVSQYLTQLNKSNQARERRSRAALYDCVEVFQNAIDDLHQSLGVLRSLSRTTFDTQMGDLNNWLSSTLTDADTCLEGFQGQRGRQVRSIQIRVTKVSYITSNALALANKLASTGFRSSFDP
ncbi:hypothetical protein UlMin_031203 [Ulmus minor]